jgi:6-pyruvoyltetrahydropterin/6-carboxytetrahydropterin synthase
MKVKIYGWIMSANIFLTRLYKIRCVHQHYNPDLSVEENEKIYYKCSRMHGHEYKVEVTVSGQIDTQTGLAISRAELDEIVETKVVKPLDLSFLNDHVGNTSGEIIVNHIHQILVKSLGNRLIKVTLRETRKNSFSSLPAQNHDSVLATL